MRRSAAGTSFAVLLLSFLWLPGPASAHSIDPNSQNVTTTWIDFESVFQPTVEFISGSNEYELTGEFDFPTVSVGEGPGDSLLVEIRIPNFVDPLDTKKLQITFVGGNPEPSDLPSVFEISAVDTPFPGGGPEVVVFGSHFLTLDPVIDDQGYHWSEFWVIHPNPDWETVKVVIPRTFEILAMHIETRSFNLVPEPSALALVGIGLLGFTIAGRRRR